MKKQRGLLTFITPYLVALIGIIVFISMYQGFTTPQVNQWTRTEFESAIVNPSYDFEKIEIVQKATVVDIAGVYTVSPSTTKLYFSLTVSVQSFNTLQATIDTAAFPAGIVVYVDAYARNIWTEIVPYLILGVILIGVLFFVTRMNGNSNSKAFDFGKSPAQLNTQKRVKFNDVAGCDEEKEEMVELVEYLKNPKRFVAMGARMPKGVILKGPPGTGKTLLARAVAGEAGVPFFSISGSNFVEMFVGVGASRVRDLFSKAKTNAPCIIFIDEIDAVGRQRGTGLGGGHDEREQTLNQLLVEMDGFEENSGILVIAATNRPDVLDPALLRPGRFDRQIIINLPDKKGREAILKVHARNKNVSSNVNFEHLAMRTPGFSGAELENVLNEAAILTVRENKNEITTEHIDEAIDRVMGGPAKKSKVMTPKERKMVAYHEAGHALIGLKLEHASIVQKVTIIPRGDAGGYVLMTPNDDRYLPTKSELLSQITGLLGGRVSEEIFFGDVTTGASSDIDSATRIARAMVTKLGMSALGPIQYEKDSEGVFLGRDYSSGVRNISGQVAYEIDSEVRKIIDDCHIKATELINQYKDTLILIAETLLTEETLTNEQITHLVNHGQLPPVVPVTPPEASDASSEVNNA